LQTDVYLKVVLTVIAVCLAVLTVKSFFQITPARARDEEIYRCDLVKIGGNYVFRSDFFPRKQ
jgi:hypothetical protein